MRYATWLRKQSAALKMGITGLPSAAAHYLEDVKDLSPFEQNHTGGVIAGLLFAERNVPTQDDAVAGLTIDIVMGHQPFALDDGTAGRDCAIMSAMLPILLSRRPPGPFYFAWVDASETTFGVPSLLPCRMRPPGALP
jgi:hypothetical protein